MSTLSIKPEPQVRGLPFVEELAESAEAVFAHLADQPGLLYLDSAVSGEAARYSFVTADPFAWLQAHRGKIALDWRAGGVSPPWSSAASAGPPGANAPGSPFPVLADLLQRYQSEASLDLPPFQGGIAGLFGYDLCHHIEKLPRTATDEFGVPDLAVGLYDWVAAFDHVAGRGWLISTGWPETEPRLRRDRAGRRLSEVQALLRRVAVSPRRRAVSPIRTGPQFPTGRLPGLTSNFDEAGYRKAIRTAIDYVHAGDCFQVNIAQRLMLPDRIEATELYRRLRERNPAPFAGYFDLGDFVIASASPERFLHLDQGEVLTCPIKGTRPRGHTPAADMFLVEDLRHSAKDRAENIMIVDLLRNDLGRVCRYGTVRVTDLCRIESYRTVHHLVSDVRGRLRDGLGPVDLLRAAFPGGSVTGAPKVRAMEIIAELEPTARGPYCGSLGYLGFDGRMDTNILIRTFTLGKGWVQFPVGGGIVADSDPAREYEETWHKAEGLLRALR
jgi:para-aminobenzoate synthetase component 1